MSDWKVSWQSSKVMDASFLEGDADYIDSICETSLRETLIIFAFYHLCVLHE